MFLVFLVLGFELRSQNLDLHSKYFSGKYYGMAGVGAGISGGVNTMDINPGSGFVNNTTYSISYNINIFSYDLSRTNADLFGIYEYDWKRIWHNPGNISVAFPVNDKTCVGVGIIRKLNPYIQNESRALTMSKLFEQETTGGLYALMLSGVYRLNEKLSTGINLYGYYGQSRSEINGDVHGADLDKWAILKNDLSGMNFRLGLLYSTENYNIGLVYETVYKLIVRPNRNLSEDKKYEYLLPLENKYKWKRPSVFRAGFSYKGIKNALFSFDIESRPYSNTDISLNVWEYAGLPDWQNIWMIRTGIESFPFKNKNIPFRIGYGYIPQLYSSNNSYGVAYTIDYYENINRINKQMITTGFSFPLDKIIVNIGISYGFFKWNRKIQTLMTVEEYYKEKNIFFNFCLDYIL